MGVSATGRKSFRQVMEGFFGMGTMVVFLKQVGTTDWYREKLNIEVNTSAIWSAHSLRTRPGMPPGPGNFCGFILLRALLTSSVAVVLVLSYPHCRSGVAHLKPCIEDVELIRERGDGLVITSISPFIVCDGSQSTPHASGVRAMVVRLQLAPVGSFGISDGTSEDHI